MKNKYTLEQLKFLKTNYKKMFVPELTLTFNKTFSALRTEGAIKSTLSRNNFKSGRTGFFPKGNKPWNTGTKGVCKPNSGSFKKGNVPGNIRPIGSERICPKDGFILVKINEVNQHTKKKTRFKHKHVVIWEKENGSVPKGCVVAFKDSNKENCELENLMLINRAELLRLNINQYKKIFEKLKPSVLLMSKLQVKISKKEKDLKKYAEAKNE